MHAEHLKADSLLTPVIQTLLQSASRNYSHGSDQLPGTRSIPSFSFNDHYCLYTSAYLSKQSRRVQSQPAHRVFELQYATNKFFFLPSHKSLNILTSLHSLFYRTGRHHHSRRRHKAVHPRTTAHVRSDPLSEWISGWEESRACHDLIPERYPHDGAADPDAVTWCLYYGAVCRSSGRWQDRVHI